MSEALGTGRGSYGERSGPWVEKSRRSLVIEAVNMDENA